MRVCVYVCVCVKERGRDAGREGRREGEEKTDAADLCSINKHKQEMG